MTALLYGCETQTLNKHKWAKVKAFLMRYLLTDLQLNDMQAYTYAFCCLVRAAYTFNKDHLLTYLLMYVRTYLLTYATNVRAPKASLDTTSAANY